MSRGEAELIARVLQDDDREAFGELVQRHQSAVRGFLRRMLHPETHLADDLAQETFVKAHRHLRAFRGESGLRGWLCAIAANELRAEWRRRKPTLELRDDLLVDSEPSPADVIDLRVDLDQALERLPAAERAALVLCLEQGLSHEEAARALACPLGTLKTHVARGKARMRRWLETDGVETRR